MGSWNASDTEDFPERSSVLPLWTVCTRTLLVSVGYQSEDLIGTKACTKRFVFGVGTVRR